MWLVTDVKGERRSDVPKKKTTLAEHVCHIGSAKNASDYITVTNFLINYIEKEYIDAGDLGQALRKGVEPDWKSLRPMLEITKQGRSNHQKRRCRESQATEGARER